MVFPAKVSDGVFEDTENLVNDIAKAFDEGLYNDVTFVLADNVSVSTNKFMLACRVPYFSSMLFGGFTESSSQAVLLKCCDSNIFKQILKFVYKGSLSFSGMTVQSILHLLEISRFFCIDALRVGIIDYLENLLDEGKMDYKDCLIALEFTVNHKFSRASGLLLSYIDKNITSISSLLEFRRLSESYLKMVVGCKESKVVDRFNAFVKWLNWQEEGSVTEDLKKEVLGLFDLRSFERKDVVEVVMKTKLFSTEAICQVLNDRLSQLEELVEVQKVKARRSVRLSDYYDGEDLYVGIQRIFTIPSPFHHGTKFNHLEFFLVSIIDCCEKDSDVCESNCGYIYSYDVMCSEDGANWNKILTCDKRNCGKQSLDFQARKMKFISVTLKEGVHKDNRFDSDDPYILDVVAMIALQE